MSEALWVEKYRPQTVEDCILPEDLKQTFSNIVKTGELPNMMFCGSAGLGKTTVARAIAKELDIDYILVNASEDGNIDMLRNKIRRFASTVSLSGGKKMIILDEADYLNAQSTQPALRGFIEEFSNNCRFILTCNFKNRIIEPLHSRCGVYEFNTDKKIMAQLCGQMLKRVKYIMEQEGTPIGGPTMQGVADLITRHAPDWRRVLNELQRSKIAGGVDTIAIASDNYHELLGHLKAKDFNKMRRWVVNNIDVDVTSIFRNLYDHASDSMTPESIPQLVLILADYQYKNAFVADHELNVVACLTEVMMNCDFK